MKRIFYFLGIAALVLAVSCKKDDKGGKDVDNIVEDGVYVVGEATGFTEVKSELLMASGRNEAKNNEVRAGMFEKYIVLQGGKEFTLTWINGGVSTKYGANLAAFTPDMDADGNLLPPYEDNPKTGISKGRLEVGDSAPSMKVSETGLYHIVLDLNQANDLSFPQIVVAKADYGVRGGMNSWGFTALDATAPSNSGMTFTLSGQKLAKGGEFKFAYGAAWKITLDAAGEVKANTNLGLNCINGGDNIAVEDAGLYKVTLNYKLAKGDIANSWNYNVTLESKSELPTTMYMIGEQFGNWDWASDGVAELVPVTNAEGLFWLTRWFDHSKGFKFCAERAWNGDFTGAGEVGYSVADGNCWVAEDGFYTVLVNANGNVVEIAPAVVYGIGDAWGGDAWDFGGDAVVFEADGAVLKATVVNDSAALRLASKVVPSAPIEGVTTGNGWIDWWKTEFIFFDGKIAYRGAGNDQERVPATAGQIIIIDFNAGTVRVD